MPEQSQQERIIVADDHPVFRDGLCRIAQRVFPQVGFGGAFWLNILLTLLGYIPGIVHAVYIIAKR